MSGAFDIIPEATAGAGGGSTDWADITNKPTNFPSSSFVHNQAVAQTVWTITHNMSKYPAVYAEDSGGSEIEGSIDYISINQLTITFSAATGGVAYLN